MLIKQILVEILLKYCWYVVDFFVKIVFNPEECGWWTGSAEILARNRPNCGESSHARATHSTRYKWTSLHRENPLQGEHARGGQTHVRCKCVNQFQICPTKEWPRQRAHYVDIMYILIHIIMPVQITQFTYT